MAPTSRAARVLLPLLGAVWISGCAGPGSSSELPVCDGASLFRDEACMVAVMERCRAIEDQQGCGAAPPIQTGDWEVVCGWTWVTPLVDADACELGPAFGRCEAGLAYHDGAAAFGICDPDGQIPDGISVFIEAREFVQIDTSSGAPLISGALGPWALIDSEPGTVAVCGENWSPPGPAWCTCAEAVCAAY